MDSINPPLFSRDRPERSGSGGDDVIWAEMWPAEAAKNLQFLKGFQGGNSPKTENFRACGGLQIRQMTSFGYDPDRGSNKPPPCFAQDFERRGGFIFLMSFGDINEKSANPINIALQFEKLPSSGRKKRRCITSRARQRLAEKHSESSLLQKLTGKSKK